MSKHKRVVKTGEDGGEVLVFLSFDKVVKGVTHYTVRTHKQFQGHFSNMYDIEVQCVMCNVNI